MSEQARRLSNRDRVLAYLQQVGTARNVDLVGVGGMRAMARIWELQRDYIIDVAHQSGGVWTVTYRGPKPTPTLLELMS